MKTTSVAVFALLSASALAQPIVVLKGSTTLNTRDIAPSELTDLEARKIHINGHKVGSFFKNAGKFGASLLFRRDIAPSELTDLEARKIHINGHKVGSFFKNAGKFGASLLFRRDEDGDLFLVARDLIDDDGELLARDFDDDFLEARDIEDYLETRGFDDYDLEARDFDDEYLVARDFDDEYLEARDLDLEERSLLSSAGRIGSHLFHHAHHVHHAASYIPQGQNNQRRDLIDEDSLYDLD